MARPPKYTAEEVAAAITEARGMLTIAARKLGCKYDTIRAYIDKYDTVKLVYHEATEQMLDAVELALYDEAVNKRNTAALIFLAKTKGKSRGYVERTEHVDIDVSQLSDEELAAILKT
jgi:hypothetical protein